jgi:AraC family transcriptional regulator
MRPTEQAIWLIESRLQQGPTLDDIARETGLSRYYLSRVFAEETGTTLAAYVRARRLSEAAKALLAGAPNILEVAIGAGYGSHEAFTRAFRAEFGSTPEEVRSRGQQQPLRFREPLRMNATPHIPLDPPVVENLPAARYVGLARRYAMCELGGIPQQWQEFLQHLDGIDRAKAPEAFGIVRNASVNGEDVEYVCALPASSGLRPGGGLEAIELPGMRLAKFTHKGHISGIRATTRAVFEEGLPAAGLRAQGPVDMIERYGPEFDPRSGFGPVGLWIHVGPA